MKIPLLKCFILSMLLCCSGVFLFRIIFQLAGILWFTPYQGKNSFTVRSNLDDNKSQDVKFQSKPVRSEIELTPLSDRVLLDKGLLFDVIKALFQRFCDSTNSNSSTSPLDKSCHIFINSL